LTLAKKSDIIEAKWEKKMKKVIIGLTIVLLLFAGCPSEEEGDDGMYKGTALDYFVDKDLRVGWNLGNSLDSGAAGSTPETGWGNPKINQELFNGIKEQGFDIVRIPITWTRQIGTAATGYKVNEAFLNRVVEVVDMALNAELVAIINMHHDGSTPSKTSETGWLSIRKSVADPVESAAITAKYATAWKQIANRFKDYGDELIFEAYNELHDGGWWWETRNDVPKEQFDVINRWAQTFTSTVRSTGGKNAKRFLLISGYCTGPEALYNQYFNLPLDTVYGKIIVSFHYYRPDGFSLNGNNATWGTQSEKTAIDTLFGRMKEYFVDADYPVIIGETGPVKNKADTDAARAARVAYTTYMFGKARENGLVPVYWDNGNFGTSGEVFGLIDRTTGQPRDAECAAVIKAMIDATR
jgi:endoglucanase